MRISDWSSGVCSADLLQDGVDHIALGRHLATAEQIFAKIIEDALEMTTALLARCEGTILDALHKLRQIIDRHAEDILKEGPAWKLRAKFADEFAFALVDEAIDQLMHVCADRPIILSHIFRAEEGIERAAPSGMARRIRFFGQKIGKIGRPIGDIALGAAERLPILAHTPHILMACHHPIAVADIASYHRALGEDRKSTRLNSSH